MARAWREATDKMIAVPVWYRTFLFAWVVVLALLGVALGILIGNLIWGVS